MINVSGAVGAVLTPIFLALVAAIFLAFARLVRGPSLPDRVVALDVMSSLAMTTIVVYAVATNQPAYIDDAVVLALISFLGTTGFALYIQRQAGRD